MCMILNWLKFLFLIPAVSREHDLKLGQTLRFFENWVKPLKIFKLEKPWKIFENVFSVVGWTRAPASSPQCSAWSNQLSAGDQSFFCLHEKFCWQVVDYLENEWVHNKLRINFSQSEKLREAENDEFNWIVGLSW